MKFTALTTILFATACNAMADGAYQHPYINGGHFEVQQEASAPIQASTPYKHEYLNGGHFDAEAHPATLAEPAAMPKLRTATLN